MIIYGIFLPIDELIFFKMVIAPPSSNWYKIGDDHSPFFWGISVSQLRIDFPDPVAQYPSNEMYFWR